MNPSSLNATSDGSSVLSKVSATPFWLDLQLNGTFGLPLKTKLLFPPGIIADCQVTVKAAAKAKDEKNNPNKIKKILGFNTPLKIFRFIFLIFWLY